MEVSLVFEYIAMSMHYCPQIIHGCDFTRPRVACDQPIKRVLDRTSPGVGNFAKEFREIMSVQFLTVKKSNRFKIQFGRKG